MAIREDAQRNHEQLFPNHESTLRRTDPELVELFDNWAFGDVLKDQTLDARTRLMAPTRRVLRGRCTGISAIHR
jgi:4-carboxymuconolactone decarboxylase